MEGPHLGGDGPPGDEDAEDVDKSRQHKEQKAQAVQPQAVANPQAGDPGVILGQQPGAAGPGLGIKLQPQEGDHQGQFGYRDDQADPAAQVGAPVEGQGQQPAQQGKKDNDRQQRQTRHHRPPATSSNSWPGP